MTFFIPVCYGNWCFIHGLCFCKNIYISSWNFICYWPVCTEGNPIHRKIYASWFYSVFWAAWACSTSVVYFETSHYWNVTNEGCNKAFTIVVCSKYTQHTILVCQYLQQVISWKIIELKIKIEKCAIWTKLRENNDCILFKLMYRYSSFAAVVAYNVRNLLHLAKGRD